MSRGHIGKRLGDGRFGHHRRQQRGDADTCHISHAFLPFSRRGRSERADVARGGLSAGR
jgi:hypothetical protein